MEGRHEGSRVEGLRVEGSKGREGGKPGDPQGGGEVVFLQFFLFFLFFQLFWDPKTMKNHGFYYEKLKKDYPKTCF